MFYITTNKLKTSPTYDKCHHKEYHAICHKSCHLASGATADSHIVATFVHIACEALWLAELLSERGTAFPGDLPANDVLGAFVNIHGPDTFVTSMLPLNHIWKGGESC